MNFVFTTAESKTDNRFEDEDSSDEEYDFFARTLVRNRTKGETSNIMVKREWQL